MNSLWEASGAFAIRLLKLLGQENPGRMSSTLPSVFSTLVMVLLGAKGSTEAQIVRTLALNAEDFHRGFQSLLTQVHRLGTPFSLSIANGLFGEESCQFLSSFQESCLQLYQAGLEQLSFTKDAERCRKHTNAWVSRKTEGKIEELLAKDSIGEYCRLVLINSVYFKGRWEEQFPESNTTLMPFKINRKEERPGQMMFRRATFPWAHVSELRARVLELPYVGQELSMVLLLPDKGVDLSTVAKELTFEKFQTWTRPEHMKRTKVEVFLPRFKLQEDYNMGSVLQRLGVVDAFHPGKADLSGMLADSDLCVSRFVHKSVVEVSEEGTEAAVPSQCDISWYCGELLPIFRADHPFLFFIRPNSTNSLLLCGRFSSP
ncbi:PREDICTED: serpin B9-like [Chinchilla lanigera]|uniref:Serpin B9-like n=1 Tax=Chinchilla lanigera TaxID=34839 RepID=A0A8C2VAR9_CHILA|nr:PREDICTED: serpin B9-like [Chinchilla lanigera]